MHDKIFVTREQLLDIANFELSKRKDIPEGFKVVEILKGAGTFSVKFSVDEILIPSTSKYDEFSSSLYDRYVIKT